MPSPSVAPRVSTALSRLTGALLRERARRLRECRVHRGGKSQRKDGTCKPHREEPSLMKRRVGLHRHDQQQRHRVVGDVAGQIAPLALQRTHRARCRATSRYSSSGRCAMGRDALQHLWFGEPIVVTGLDRGGNRVRAGVRQCSGQSKQDDRDCRVAWCSCTRIPRVSWPRVRSVPLEGEPIESWSRSGATMRLW